MPTTDFRLLYDVGKGKVSTRCSVTARRTTRTATSCCWPAPRSRPPTREDPSQDGGLRGRPLGQHERQEDRAGPRGAASSCSNNLREGDLFNIVAYDSQVEILPARTCSGLDRHPQGRLGFVEGIYAGGSTNIDGALCRRRWRQLQDSSRPNYVLFLTDGLPTAGETNEIAIAEGAHKANKVRARIFTFGVGYDVNSRLLDRLVRENRGQSEYVRPDEDIEDRVARFFSKLTSPVLSKIAMRFDKTQVNRAYPPTCPTSSMAARSPGPGV